MFTRFRGGSVSEQSDCSSTVTSLTSGSTHSSSVSSVDNEVRLHQRWVFLTYARCSLEVKEEFEESFNDMLQRNELLGATYYGCQEPHKVKGIHYHVLVNLGKQVNWSFKFARECFRVDGNDCESLHISTVRPGQSIGQFIAREVRYIEKLEGAIVFGERPVSTVEKQLERKRKWEEIGAQPTAAEKLAKVKAEFPDAFYKSFNNVRSAVEYEHQNEDFYEAFELPNYVRPENFRVPQVIVDWEFDNLIAPKPGRRKSLLIVGDTRTGKSSLAQFIASCYGVFSEFDTEWDLHGYREGHMCAVFHDIQKGFRYWKGVFGCQPFITVHARYAPTRKLKWNVPSIWVCNYEDDPRNWDDSMRSYIEGNAVVYEVPRGTSLYSNEDIRGAPGAAWGGEALGLPDVGSMVIDGCMV